ncbi:glycosyltransferase [Isoptericola sp. NEAU-Y5]|uniref:Glycosyltransferase n=1 Tax=Isoptericola luteus TaxID=2879484 RepID=A0ABS7ZCF1_9MICO|nr:glycosyltransferase [Isoptericola sp. NEAU-Y5]MCA5892728.1 glycosyltransferase [Isoptericola sp. NEAU-Y5]
MVNELTASAQGVSFGVDPEVVRAHADLFRTRRGGVDRLVATALRTRSYDCRQVIAAVIDPELSLPDLVAQVREARVPHGDDLETAAQALAGLARVFALQSLLPTDRADAIALYRAAGTLQPYTAWKRVDVLTFAQLLLEAGELDDGDHDRVLGRVTRLERHFLRADLEARRTPAEREGWLSHVNAALESLGVAPVALRSPAAAFDDLTGAAPLPPVEGPLVTVIMPAYEPGDEIFTAARSILEQTWSHLELIVVDDGSGAQFSTVFADVAELDPRVTVLRNALHDDGATTCDGALRAAHGDLVTFQSADGWSHPERLAHQAQALLDDTDVPYTRVRAARCRTDLSFTRLGYGTVSDDADSLMFRRATLQRLEESGPHANTAARLGEHLDEAFPGEGRTLNTLLAFARDVERRSTTFPLPRAGSGTDERAHFDVVFAGDWRRFGGPQRSMLEEIGALVPAGLRIGVMQIEALRFATTRDEPLCAAVRELIADGVVHLVNLDDPVMIDVLLIRYPPVLEFLSSVLPTAQAATVVIVANQVPIESDGTDRRYTVADCDAHARAMFGIEPYWLPQGPLVRTAIEAEGAPAGLLPYDNPGIIDVDAWSTPRQRLRGVRPVIGRVSRDAALKWPSDPDELLEIYPVTPDVDVRIMGGRRTVTAVLGAVPAEWLVFDINEVPPRTVLNQIDFFVYFHHPVLQEAFGRVILEALAAGCVVILPHHFEPVFGDAALYCTPSEVQDLVRRYHADPPLYRAQARRGQTAARDQNGHEHFRELVKNLAALPTLAGAR